MDGVMRLVAGVGLRHSDADRRAWPQQMIATINTYTIDIYTMSGKLPHSALDCLF